MGSGTRCSRKSKHVPCLIHDTRLCQLDIKMTTNYYSMEPKIYKLKTCIYTS